MKTNITNYWRNFSEYNNKVIYGDEELILTVQGKPKLLLKKLDEEDR